MIDSPFQLTFGHNTHYNNSCHLEIRRLRRFQLRLFLAPEIFIPDAYGTKNRTGAENRRQKMESIYVAGFSSVCHGN